MPLAIPDPDEAVAGLIEPFRSRCVLLRARLERDGLPFVLFETTRSFTRQQSLYEQGRAKDSKGVWRITDSRKIVTKALPGQGAHNWGLAVDFVLDTDNPWWEGTKPTWPWDTGKRPDGTSVRPVVALAWEKYGRAVRESGLRWGGDWGWDLPHAEMPDWRGLRPKNWALIVQEELAAGR